MTFSFQFPTSLRSCIGYSAFFAMLLQGVSVYGQERTVGLFQNDPGSFNGYTLFTPLTYTETYLLDNNGFLVNTWHSDYPPASMVYLLENGHLLRTANPGTESNFIGGGAGGLIEEYDWDGNLVWQFEYNSVEYRPHHDIAPMPNGNILMIAWELKTSAEAIAAGRNPALLDTDQLWPEHIIEVKPEGSGGQIVWEWHAWDHLIQDFDQSKDNFGIVASHPELIDINFIRNGAPDWLHFNAIDYNPQLDQIVLSVALFGELWVIDHSTTTEEAAGHVGGNSGKGGDLLYRWGNPQAYRAGGPDEQKLLSLHDAHWIDAGLPGEGNLLLFNNRAGATTAPFSSVDELTPPIDANGNYFLAPGAAFAPDTLVWRYTAPNPPDFFSGFISSAQRLPNGNTLICDGDSGTFLEVTPDGETVWLYVSPVAPGGPISQGEPIAANFVFRALRYGPDYPGLAGRELTPGDPIEQNPISSVESPRQAIADEFVLLQNYPNPFNPSTVISFQLPAASDINLAVYNLRGQLVKELISGVLAAGQHQVTWNGEDLNGARVASSVYVYRLKSAGFTAVKKLTLIR